MNKTKSSPLKYSQSVGEVRRVKGQIKRHHWPIYFSTKGFRGAVSTDPPNIPAPFFREKTEAQGVNSRIQDYKTMRMLWDRAEVDYASRRRKWPTVL